MCYLSQLAIAPILLWRLLQSQKFAGRRHWYAVVIQQKLCLVLLGLVTWEVVVQLPFDWSIISGEVRFGAFPSPRQARVI